MAKKKPAKKKAKKKVTKKAAKKKAVKPVDDTPPVGGIHSGPPGMR